MDKNEVLRRTRYKESAPQSTLSDAVQAKGHGGSRRPAHRVSATITMHQAQNVLRASERAIACNKPFNRFTTLHFSALGIAGGRDQWATQRYIKLASDWMATRGCRMPWVWVRETGPKEGPHVHILLHLPPFLSADFVRRERGWLKQIREESGAGLLRSLRKKGASESIAIARSLSSYVNSPAFYHVNLMAVISYLLKGAAVETITKLGLKCRHHPGGEIFGKRVSWWQERKT